MWKSCALAGFPRAVGSLESSLLAFQAFHGPPFPQLWTCFWRFSFLSFVFPSSGGIGNDYRARLQNVRSVRDAIQQCLAYTEGSDMTCVHSENGRFVVTIIRPVLSARSAM